MKAGLAWPEPTANAATSSTALRLHVKQATAMLDEDHSRHLETALAASPRPPSGCPKLHSSPSTRLRMTRRGHGPATWRQAAGKGMVAPIS
ncbi:hypothetical protein [Mesorhizobium sp. M2A.F.Ca.ET.042.01.1.1]|uniref:hypothetical protein n=1 Tax=Mesorhizobium sp. M2A.F.Ca.ET.042.01.1.1 TaxID=2496745 RepID=UPI0011AE9DF6|nr:hypothetical protein [Mesorhizobium sp. M2A.F.Ca.ET.042.01.1.1]